MNIHNAGFPWQTLPIETRLVPFQGYHQDLV